jgi:hypothetical protein
MSQTESIKWVVCPNGTDPTGQNFQVSVFAGVVLSGGPSGTLADFPDFQNWPSTLLTTANLEFEFSFDVGGTTVASWATGVGSSSPLSEQLWTNLFPSSTEYVEQTSSNQPRILPIVSYPTSQIVSFITGQYHNLPTTQVPTHAQVSAVFNDIRPTLVGISPDEALSTGLESFSQIQSRLAAERLAPGASGDIPYANNFHDATTAEAFAAHAAYFLPTDSPPPPGFSPSKIDFHAAQGFVGEHRWLQRALGFAFDFEIPISNLTGQGLSLGSLISDLYVSVSVGVQQRIQGNVVSSAAPDLSGGSFTPIGTPVSPQTRCYASTTVFEPYSETADTDVLPLSGGLVVIGDETRFSAHTMSVELGGLRAASFSSALQTAVAPATTSAVAPLTGTLPFGDSFAPPQVLSSSLSLAIMNRGTLFVAQFGRLTSLAEAFSDAASFAPQAHPLQASDLVRGLVLDVLDTTTGRWYSTNRRSVTYSSPATNPTVAHTEQDDEGGTQAPPTQTNTPNGSAPPTLAYAIPETVLTYNGWSNGVPLPGNQTQDADSALGTSGGPFGEEISIEIAPVAGSLPLLRFGRTYYLRARDVDIAGNVVPLGLGTPIDNGENLVNGPILYARYEGVNPPDAYALQNTAGSYPLSGESARWVVIRDIDITAAGGSFSSSRLLAPPRSTVAFAERHGMFDNAAGTFDPGVGTSSSWYDVITASNLWGQPRESGQYLPNQGQSIPLPPTGRPASTPLQSLVVPYLPDPLAKGGVISILPLGPMSPGSVTFDFLPSAGWPSYQPVQLILQASAGGSRAASYDSSARTVTFAIDPADVVPLAVACTFNAADVSTYALGQLVPGVDPALAARGDYWAITPPGDLTLVYAVKQPLIAPELSIPEPPRSRGDTFVLLAGTCTYSPKSTSTIDVVASWGEPIDIPGAGYASEVDPSVRGYNALVSTTMSAVSPLEPVTEPSLVPARTSVLQGPGAPNPTLASTSDVQVFQASPVNTATSSGGANTAVEGFENAGDIQIYSITDSFSNGRHEFHDTKHRQVTYSAIGTTAFTSQYKVGEDVAVESDLTLASTTPVTVDILSSARPAGLTIPYVVPIYEWQSVTTDGVTGEITAGRQPSALRVFIERPWWSSGIDELLGVTTWPDAEPTYGSGQTSGPVQIQTRGHSKVAHSGHGSKADAKHASKAAAGKGAHKSTGTVAIGAGTPVKVAPLPVAENPPPQIPISEPTSLYVSDWGSDPLFAGASLPTPHPNYGTFTNAVSFGGGLSIEEHSGITVNVAGHNVEYDELRDMWYSDVAVDFGDAYTPMIRLALARFQPNSISGVELGRITQADIMSLEPGRSVSVIPYKDAGKVYLNVALSGVSYTQVAGINRVAGGIDAAPGIAQVLLEERESGITDEDLGWRAVGDPVTMTATTSKGITTWEARGIPIPSGHGQFRLYLNQYEILPSEERPDLSDQFPAPTTPVQLQARGRRPPEKAVHKHGKDERAAGHRRPRTSTGSEPPAGYRLLYQDMIPVSNHLPRLATRLGSGKAAPKTTKHPGRERK